MFSTSALVVCILSALSLTATSPMKRAATCSPNFEGASVAVVNNDDVEWSAFSPTVGTSVRARTSPAGDPLNFELTGSATPSYVIKDVNATANNVVVGVGSDNTLYLQELINGTPNSAQTFSVSCTSCGANKNSELPRTVASNCTISQTSTGLCVGVAGSVTGDLLLLQPCTDAVSQQFDFVLGVF